MVTADRSFGPLGGALRHPANPYDARARSSQRSDRRARHHTMTTSSKPNAVVGQSGGPTAVINQSLVGVILEERKHGHIGKLLGARHGVRGIVSEDFIDL